MWKNFAICGKKNVQSAANCQTIEPLTEKTWGRGRVVLVVSTKWGNISLEGKGELLAKNMAKTARRQLAGRHLLFGEYLHKRKRTLSKMNLTSMRVSMFLLWF